jgi:hypothetical protein
MGASPGTTLPNERPQVMAARPGSRSTAEPGLSMLPYSETMTCRITSGVIEAVARRCW